MCQYPQSFNVSTVRVTVNKNREYSNYCPCHGNGTLTLLSTENQYDLPPVKSIYYFKSITVVTALS